MQFSLKRVTRSLQSFLHGTLTQQKDRDSELRIYTKKNPVKSQFPASKNWVNLYIAKYNNHCANDVITYFSHAFQQCTWWKGQQGMLNTFQMCWGYFAWWNTQRPAWLLLVFGSYWWQCVNKHVIHPFPLFPVEWTRVDKLNWTKKAGFPAHFLAYQCLTLKPVESGIIINDHTIVISSKIEENKLQWCPKIMKNKPEKNCTMV